MTDHTVYMRRAMRVAERNPRHPFGALLVDAAAGEIVAEGVNRTSENPIWHGEIDVINRYAAQSRRSVPWGALHLYTTAEPCPMCQSAIVWSGIARVVYGSSIQKLKELGWNQIDITSSEVVRRAPFFDCEILGGVMQAECDQLFQTAIALRGR